MNKEVTILRTSRKGIEIEVIENEVSGVKWKIDTTKHDKQIRAELIEELCNRHSDDNSWCEFTIDVIVAELEEIAQELKK